MSRVLQIMKREYLETARSKWFIIGTVVLPLLLSGMMTLPAFFIRSGADASRVAVVDEPGGMVAALRAALEADDRLSSIALVEVPGGPGAVEGLRQAVARKEYDGLLHLPADVLESGKAVFIARGLSIASERLDNILTEVVTRRRLVDAGVDPGRLDALTAWVEVDVGQIGEGGEIEKKRWGAVYIVTFAFVMFIYFTIAIYGVTVMNSTVQEKSSRVMEVLLASTSPFELLMGKLLGKGAVGLTQLGAWALAALLLALLGGSAATIEEVPLASIVPVSAFGWFLVFFVLGFFTMASVYAALGSICNTPEEATQLQFPAIMPMILALLLSFMVISHPDRPIGIILSFVPFLSPILMFVRILVQTPPLWQILLAVLINLLTILGMVWLAARVYRIGILMYGKRPTVPEIARWIRAT